MILRPPRATRTDTLFPDTTLFRSPAQDLPSSLRALAQATGQQISFDSATIGRKKAPALDGNYTVREAVDRLLAGSGLEASWGESGVLVIRAAPKADANAAGEQGAGSGYTANEIVVTAQKRVESIQDVPIAMTALSQDDLTEQKIESGADIMRAVPNLTFSKSNFSGYNVSIRGIGTKRSEEHTSELQSLMRISYAVFCLKKKKQTNT